MLSHHIVAARGVSGDRCSDGSGMRQSLCPGPCDDAFVDPVFPAFHYLFETFIMFQHTVFTIGYGGRSKDQFLELLMANGVKTVVDIRLRPDRASMGIWVKAKTSDKGIEHWLAESGIGYRSIIELGNVFLDFSDWVSHYQRLMEQAGDLLVERVLTIPGPLCLMCAEKRVADCHRRIVADYLQRKYGAIVSHIE